MSSFLPRKPSAFQQAICKDLVRVVHLGRAAILSYKMRNGFVDCPRLSWPRRKNGDGCENPASELQSCVNVDVV